MQIGDTVHILEMYEGECDGLRLGRAQKEFIGITY